MLVDIQNVQCSVVPKHVQFHMKHCSLKLKYLIDSYELYNKRFCFFLYPYQKQDSTNVHENRSCVMCAFTRLENYNMTHYLLGRTLLAYAMFYSYRQRSQH